MAEEITSREKALRVEKLRVRTNYFATILACYSCTGVPGDYCTLLVSHDRFFVLSCIDFIYHLKNKETKRKKKCLPINEVQLCSTAILLVHLIQTCTAVDGEIWIDIQHGVVNSVLVKLNQNVSTLICLHCNIQLQICSTWWTRCPAATSLWPKYLSSCKVILI